MSVVTDLAAHVAEKAEFDLMRSLTCARDRTIGIARRDVTALSGVAALATAYVAAIRAYELATRAPAPDAVRVRWFEQLLGERMLEAAEEEVTRQVQQQGEMQS